MPGYPQWICKLALHPFKKRNNYGEMNYGQYMQKKSVIIFAILFLIQSMAAGLAVIPSQSSEDSWQSSILGTSARDGNNSSSNNSSSNNSSGNNTVTSNTAPVVSNVSISPTAALQNDELTCNYDVYDADGDTIIVNVTWLVNGVVINIDWQSDTLSSAFNFEDEVGCSVTASDGQQTSNAVNDSITILPASSFVSNDDDDVGLPALGAFGTMAAIVAGIFASRRKDE